MAYIKIIVPDEDNCDSCDFLDTKHSIEYCSDNVRYQCRIFGNHVDDKKKCVACKMMSMLSNGSIFTTKPVNMRTDDVTLN